MGKQRARSEQQKDKRRIVLLRATQDLFEQMSYETVTMAHIAEMAGLAKGTVFFYFKTKEELFLALKQQVLQEWFEEAETKLSQIPPGSSIQSVATLLAHSLGDHPTLLRLFALLHTTLENNVEYETLWHFKLWMQTQMRSLGILLEHCLPFLEPGQGIHVLLLMEALFLGLHQLASPKPIASQVLQAPEMQMFHIDFVNEFARTLTTFLCGLEREAGEKQKQR